MQGTSDLCLPVKSHIPSFLNGQKNALLCGQDACYTISTAYKIGFIIT